MSRDFPPYSPRSGSRAESWRPDRSRGAYDDDGRYGATHGGASGYGSDSAYASAYGDDTPYGSDTAYGDGGASSFGSTYGYDHGTPRARRYTRSSASTSAPYPPEYTPSYLTESRTDGGGSGRYPHRTQVLDDDRRTHWDDHGGNPRDDAYDAYDGADAEDYPDDVYEYYEPLDRRWVWVAGVAGAILLVAVICTVVILGGGDSGSVSATVAAPTTSGAPATTPGEPAFTSARPTAPPPPVASLPAETVTTVSPTPSATAAPPAAPAPAPAPDPSAAPGTITYAVTGTRSLLDLVTVIYTDAQGALQTDVNVALPWHKTIVLDPGVTLTSVTATSVTGQLNCAITDAAGATIAAQTSNSLITTCTR